jgi:hypothetical protein
MFFSVRQRGQPKAMQSIVECGNLLTTQLPGGCDSNHRSARIEFAKSLCTGHVAVAVIYESPSHY